MNKIEKLHESIRALFRTEGEKFCYTPGEIERLVCSLNYKRLHSVLCDTAEPVYICCAGGGMASRIHREVYVRFWEGFGQTYGSNAARRLIPTLRGQGRG